MNEIQQQSFIQRPGFMLAVALVFLLKAVWLSIFALDGGPERDGWPLWSVVLTAIGLAAFGALGVALAVHRWKLSRKP